MALPHHNSLKKPFHLANQIFSAVQKKRKLTQTEHKSTYGMYSVGESVNYFITFVDYPPFLTHSLFDMLFSSRVLPSSCFPESHNSPSFKSKISKLDLISVSS